MLSSTFSASMITDYLSDHRLSVFCCIAMIILCIPAVILCCNRSWRKQVFIQFRKHLSSSEKISLGGNKKAQPSLSLPQTSVLSPAANRETGPSPDTEKQPLPSSNTLPQENAPLPPLPFSYFEKIETEDLGELIKARMEDIAEDAASEEKWAIGIVELLDELSWMSASYSAHDAKIIRELDEELRSLLNVADCSLIDDDHWNPERQRAVSMPRDVPWETALQIEKKGRSGLIVKGKLIRKQEVYLNISQTH